jgi:lipopolysaccharide/colanic/teichoic acid biosynthesis glycosyltransferase
MKRLFDVTAAATLLLLLSPILLLIGLAIVILDGRPVLFTQPRPGMNGKIFKICKFRTMREAFDSKGEALPDERRLTGLGRFLRSTSLDELPELWNVLRGDMSLVGPRPLRVEYLPLYTVEQRRRHELKPGLTGWAQIHGRNETSWEERFELDTWYVENHSFFLDLKILLLTLGQVVTRRGIAAPGHATMPRFTGTTQDRDR